MLGIVILGSISVDRLGTDLFPSMYNPQLVVELQSGERSPLEMETRFARQLEGDVRSVSHVVDVHTLCRLGIVQVTVTFAWGTDMDFALLDVQKKIARYETRSDVDRVTLSQYDPQAAPVLIYTMSGASRRDLDEIRRLAENVVKLNLERLDGVARVQVYGGVRREVLVKLDAYRLAAYQISQQNVADAIRQSNADASGGTLDYNNKAYTIKGIGRFGNIDNVGATVVGYKSSGADEDSLNTGNRQSGRVFEPEKIPIYLTDVATVTYTPADRTELVRLGGRDCLALYIYKKTIPFGWPNRRKGLWTIWPWNCRSYPSNVFTVRRILFQMRSGKWSLRRWSVFFWPCSFFMFFSVTLAPPSSSVWQSPYPSCRPSR